MCLTQAVGERYRIDGRLGRGGMSWVFRGTHVALSSPVAIKLLDAREASKPENAERFMREARLAARVRSKNVVSILDAGTGEDGGRYCVMEYLDGATLDVEIRRRRPNLGGMCRLGAQIARGLADVHAAGIVHRDVKPTNVVVTHARNGATRCVLIDFGIAAPESELEEEVCDGKVWGTPRFMAPEQARGARVTTATDVYALGVILYDMVTGRLPFTERCPSRVMRAHIRNTPPPIATHAPHCPLELAQLIHRCMSKKPDGRPTAEQVAVALETLQEGRSTQRSPSSQNSASLRSAPAC